MSLRKLLREHWWLTVASGGVLLIILAGLFHWPLGGFGRRVVDPFASWLTSAGARVGKSFGEVAKVGTYADANHQLSGQLNQAEQALVAKDALERENASLRDLLAFKNRPAKYKLVGADVLAYVPDSLLRELRINRGGNDGVKAGNAVMAGGNLVGVVTGVDPLAATVRLVNDPNFRALVTVGKEQVPGIVKGKGLGGATVERLPIGVRIKSGDAVTTSGLDGAFAPGLYIGFITSVEPSDEAIFQTAHLELASDLDHLSVVGVIQAP